MTTTNLKLSGHDSFHCRPYWLKKGYDFLDQGNKFSDKAGIELGVGRNMVNSIRFWLKAFDLVDENENLNLFATKLLSDSGWDPYLEDEATLWLLHYRLCKTKYSSLYNLIFTSLRKVRPEFTRNHFSNLVNEIDSNQSKKIIETDFNVFVRCYDKGNAKSDKEESYSGLFTELGLLTELRKNEEKDSVYNISNTHQGSIPWQILLFCIIDNPHCGLSVNLNDLFAKELSIGNILVFNREQLDLKFIEIAENCEGVVYSNDAGLKVLQFKKKLSAIEILKGYYEG